MLLPSCSNLLAKVITLQIVEVGGRGRSERSFSPRRLKMPRWVFTIYTLRLRIQSSPSSRLYIFRVPQLHCLQTLLPSKSVATHTPVLQCSMPPLVPCLTP